MLLDKRNLSEFKMCNIDKWIEAGWTGHGVPVTVWDGFGERDDEHGECVRAVIQLIAPECIMTTCQAPGSDNIPDNTLLLNMSMKGNLLTNGYLDELNDKGMLIVCGAGNDGQQSNHYESEPSQKPYTLSVGAVEYIGSHYKARRKEYSSYGLDVLDIMGYTNIYVHDRKFTGTSCATPFITGMLALWCEWFKDENDRFPTKDEIWNMIKNNCLDLEDEGKDTKTGFGLFVLPDNPPKKTRRKTTRIVMKLDDKNYRINGKDAEFEVAPKVIKINEHHSKTVLELRSLCELAGYKVTWIPLPNKIDENGVAHVQGMIVLDK